MKKKSRGSWESKKHRDYKYRDKKKGNKYAFSLEQSKALLHLPCFYCTKPLAKGLDRLNNDLGYEDGNVVACCENCNVILGTLPKEAKMEMREALRSIHEKDLLKNWKPVYMIPVPSKTEEKSIAGEEVDSCENCESPADGVSLDDVPLCDDCGVNLSVSTENFADQCGALGDPMDSKTPICISPPGHDGPHKTFKIKHEFIDQEYLRSPTFIMNGFPEKYIQSPSMEGWVSGSFADIRGTFAEKLSPYEKDVTAEESPVTIFSSSVQGDVDCEVIKQGDPKNGVYYPLLTLEEVRKLLDEGIEARQEFEERQRKLRWTKCLYCNCWVDSCKCKAV